MADTGNFSNGFGTVMHDRVSFNVKKSFFGGTSVEDLPMRHVTSIRSETTRQIGVGILFLLIGIGCLAAGSGIVTLVGLIIAALGALFLWGFPSVTINTAGGDKRVSLGNPTQRGEADAYAAAVRQQLFKD